MDADEPMQAPSDISQLAERVAELRASLDALRPAFEVSVPTTVGGAPAALAYTCLVRYASPCEVSVVSLTNSDASHAATVILSTDPNLDLLASNAATMTASLDGQQGFIFLGTVLASTTLAGAPQWFPVQGETALYVRVSGAGSNAAYVTLQFRRRINPSGVQSAGF